MAALPTRPNEEFLSQEGGGGTVHVAVGTSVEKTAALLKWTFSMFPGQEICLLHVHRPSSFIPTLLGKLPASRANPELIAAYRNEEKEETMKLLSNYLITCSRSEVKASYVTAESDDVQKAIVNLVIQHTIRKLVVGAIPDFVKGKKSSSKATHVAKHAPLYCEVWFINKGKLIWTRQASASSSLRLPSCQLATRAHSSIPCPSYSCQKQVDGCQTDIIFPTVSRCVKCSCDPLCSHSGEEGLCIKLGELRGKVDESKYEAYLKLLESKQLEAEALEAVNKVKALELARSHEVKLRIDAEDALRITIQGQEKLFEEREKIIQQLRKTMRNIALLESRVQEAKRRREEVSGELKLIQASIVALRNEKQRLQWQNIEASRWLDRWRSREQCEDGNKSKFNGLKRDDALEFPEFLLSDVETATCNFSESFRIGKGGYGIVYKGEMFGKTVAVKKLHSYNMQRQTEFHAAVQVLGKLHHPNLVELIGVCLESWLLVYEYMPGGSLHNHLSNQNGIGTLDWKTRARIVADIAGTLLFLHSFRPKRIVHGNLKPENLLLDSQKRCKVSDYGDHMLTAGQTFRCPSFGRGSKSSGVSLYTDPEYHRSGTPTHKSDIYSLGVITLQLVTGRTNRGLVGEVRRALSNGNKVASILDLSGGDWSMYVGRRLLELGLQCCESNGRDRPELTPSLVKELERMPLMEEQTVPSFFLCPILREIMHDPHVAADGFTYEGEALREWLGNGHETSPMTNLKLSHFDLTPNHSLRHAIQDWIANIEIPT